MRLPPGLCLGPHLGASSSPSWQTLGLTIAEGPTELRAPGPRDPTIRHWVGVGLHAQPGLSGHLTLTSIISYTVCTTK